MSDYNKEDYIRYRLEKAKETINEVDILIKNQLWNTSVNRMYYACFYMVNALLLKHGFEASTHKGCRLMFGKHFIQTKIIDNEMGKLYTKLFEMRHKGDYDDFSITMKKQ
jgi:uncharacterized protein (UPF0332 family)